MLTADTQPHRGEATPCLDAKALAGNSVEAVRRLIAGHVRERGLHTPELEARLLVGHALALNHTALAAQARRRILPAEAARIAALVGRRLRREPTARILGQKEFWGLPFKIDPPTFVPRPETETVVEAALQAIGESGRCSRELRIADLGTGAGTLLLSLLSELPEALGVGTDISEAAIGCARYNAAVQRANAAFVVGSYAASLQGPIDLLVSNPPYIPSSEIATLEPEVRAFDPVASLDGGWDGLDGYRTIANEAGRLLAPNGIVVVELGVGQAAPVRSLFSAAGLASAALRPDLSGTPRALVSRRLA
jgi:release factor glutamine methyltransferase